MGIAIVGGVVEGSQILHGQAIVIVGAAFRERIAVRGQGDFQRVVAFRVIAECSKVGLVVSVAGFAASDGRYLINLAAGGQGVGGVGQRLHIERIWLSQGKGIHQSGNAIAHLLYQRNQHRSWFNAAVNDPVKHVLHGPAQLAHGAGTDHAAGAFQSVEGATEFHQGFLIAGVGGPAREKFIQRVQDFADFFLEDFDDFVIDQIVIIVRGTLGDRLRLVVGFLRSGLCFLFGGGRPGNF